MSELEWPQLVVLTRHPESEGNVLSSDDCSGLTTPNHDYALTERGRWQAEVTGAYLRDHFGEFDAHYVSTFRRTQEMMNIMFPLAEMLGDARLNEWWRGIWHTMSAGQIEEHFPVEGFVREREGSYHYRAPGGQNGPDVELGIHSFNADLRRLHRGQKVLIAAHGNWMILFQRIVQQFSVDEAMRRRQLRWFDNASVVAYKCLPENPQYLVPVSERVVPWEGLEQGGKW